MTQIVSTFEKVVEFIYNLNIYSKLSKIQNSLKTPYGFNMTDATIKTLS